MSKLAETLLAARHLQGWTLDEVEQGTRIRTLYLEALENDRFERLPSPVYTRGFVRNYASFLGLEPARVVRLYDDAIGYRPEPVRIEPQGTIRIAGLVTPNVAAIGIALVLAGVVFVWLYSAFFVVGETNLARQTTPIIPTPTALASFLVPTVEVSPTLTATPALSVVATATPVPTTVATATLVATAPLPRGTPSPTIDPALLALMVKVVDQPSWLQIRTDGVVTFTGTLAAGTQRTFTARNEIYIHAGRADAVDIVFDGVPQGRLGNTSQVVVRRTFTRPVATSTPRR